MSIDPREWSRYRTSFNYDALQDPNGAFANVLADVGVPLYSPIGRAAAQSYAPGLANAFLVSGAQTNRQLGNQTMAEQYRDYATNALRSGTATQKIRDAYMALSQPGFGDLLRGPYKEAMAQGGAYATGAGSATPSSSVTPTAATPAPTSAQPNPAAPEKLFPITGASQQPQPSWEEDMNTYIRQNYGGNRQQAIIDLINRGILPPGATETQLAALFQQDEPKVGLGSQMYDQPDELTNAEEARLRSEGYSLEGGRYVYRGIPRSQQIPNHPPVAGAAPAPVVSPTAAPAGVPSPAGGGTVPSGLQNTRPLNPYVGALLSLLYDPSSLSGFQQGLAAPLMGNTLAGGLRDLTGLRIMGAQRTMNPTDDFFRAIFGR